MVHDYRKMMDPSYSKPEGWTHKEFRYDEPKCSWYGTIYYGKEGTPVHMSWYVWEVTTENFSRCVAELLGPGYKLSQFQGGNGHYDALVVLKDQG